MKLKEKISLEEVCGQTFKIRVVEASEYGKILDVEVDQLLTKIKKADAK